MEFKPFPKIERIGKASMHITQKIHGTNVQVFIYKDEAGELQLKCGSRTRWIIPGDDNYGFAAHVYAHKQEFIDKLGEGQHFGEWAGLGINSGEGLLSKMFVLFDFWKYPPERLLPPRCTVVPVLYQGPVDLSKVYEVMIELKVLGSRLCPGFMRPEGVVIMAFGQRYKKVFEAEETAWQNGDTNLKKLKDDSKNEATIKYGHLLQPIRLEKVVSKDERLTTGFPKTMPEIVNVYIRDLIEEQQIVGTAEEIEAIKKAAGPLIFKMVRELMLK